MDIGPVPKTFWYSVSFAILAGTVGVLFLAFRSQSVTIQTEKATFVFQKASDDAADAKLLADELKSQSEALTAARAELKVKYEELAELEKKLSSGAAHLDTATLPKSSELPDLPAPEEFQKYSTALEKVSSDLETAAQMKPWEQRAK